MLIHAKRQISSRICTFPCNYDENCTEVCVFLSFLNHLDTISCYGYCKTFSLISFDSSCGTVSTTTRLDFSIFLSFALQCRASCLIRYKHPPEIITHHIHILGSNWLLYYVTDIQQLLAFKSEIKNIRFSSLRIRHQMPEY